MHPYFDPTSKTTSNKMEDDLKKNKKNKNEDDLNKIKQILTYTNKMNTTSNKK